MQNESGFSKFISDIKNNKAKKELGEYLTSQLSREQAQTLNTVLNDEKALNELLSSEKAQNILKQLTGEDNG